MADVKISGLPASTLPLAGTEVLPLVQSGVTKKVASDDLTVKNVRSNATTGILQVAGPTAGETRVMTTPNANFNVARTDAGQTFAGLQTFSNSGNENISLFGGSNITTIQQTGAATFINLNTNFPGSGSCYWRDTNAYVTVMGLVGSTGDLTLNKGNLVIGTAGKGIDFSADGQAAGMTSELLDDYEEGTWTPTLGGDATYNFQSGVYTKIGRLVIANCILMVNTIGTGATNNVSGLPFTVRSQTQNFSGSCQYFESLANTIVYIAPSPNAGADSLTFFTLAAAGGTTSYNTALWQNGTRIDFTVMYFT